MEFSKFSKQKFGENQNKTTLIGAVTGLQGMELSDAHQRAQERAASTQQDGLWDILRNSFLDKSSNDQVVDSFTGQVIQVDKPVAIGGTVKGAGKSAGAYYTNLSGGNTRPHWTRKTRRRTWPRSTWTGRCGRS